jgi:SAM-dependent methyltransferase
MYGGSKESGQIVGKVESTTAEVSFDEVAENTGCHESLQCADADGNEMTLSASLDSASGALIWRVEQSEEEVRRRVLSTNQMTSMLHDKERNRVYEKAITKIIANFVDKMDRRPAVLDVGAGTGLLSMMAARAGAEGVVGCEMYGPMAAVAEHVVADNGMSEEVQIIPAKSTDIDGFKVDLLVSELLDSALLGESCVFSHADAIGRLIAEENENLNIPVVDRVIPHSATIYGKLVESVEVEKMVSVREFNLGIDSNGTKIGTPWRDDKEASRCQGGWPLIPVHWPSVKQRSEGEEVSEGTELLRFNFTRSDADDTPQSYLSELEVTLPAGRKDGEGVVSGLLLFWRLDLLSPSIDPERELFYTTDPRPSHALAGPLGAMHIPPGSSHHRSQIRGQS